MQFEQPQPIKSETEPKETRELAKTELSLPFERLDNKELSWAVARQHLPEDGWSVIEQQHGYDFIVQDNADDSYKESENELENYYAFGKKVLSPSKGRVVYVMNEVNDNIPPTEINGDNSMRHNVNGNCVIVDHGNGEYSNLAHFKKGSIKVNVGEEVETGNELGQVGSSGNSSEPHIHYNIFKLRDGYTIEQIVQAMKKPYPFFELDDEDRTEEGFKKFTQKFLELKKKYQINNNSKVEEMPNEFLELVSPLAKSMIGVQAVFQGKGILQVDDKL